MVLILWSFVKHLMRKRKLPECKKGIPLPVVITVYNDRSFTFIIKTPPASILIKRSSWILQKAAVVPNTNKVGKVTRAQLEEIAK